MKKKPDSCIDPGRFVSEHKLTSCQVCFTAPTFQKVCPNFDDKQGDIENARYRFKHSDTKYSLTLSQTTNF